MRTLFSVAGGVVVFALAAALWVNQCSGPVPTDVGSPTVRAREQPGDPYMVEAVIRNQGPGHGGVKVLIRLRDASTGDSYQEEQQADLEYGETVHVVAEISAPPGQYEPHVEVQYPPK